MGSFLSKFGFGKKVVCCPSCRKGLRLPYKSGKTLRVTCPNCRCLFNVQFSNPITEVFRYDSNVGFRQNIRAAVGRFNGLPKKGKVSLSLLFVSILFLMFMIVGQLTQMSTSEPTPSLESPMLLPKIGI